MKVEILGKKYMVRFAHSPVQSRQTDCFLYPMEDGVLRSENLPQPIVMGIAFCHWKDNFERRVGRKIAFSRLILNMEEAGIIPAGAEGKELRTYLWNEYLKNFRV